MFRFAGWHETRAWSGHPGCSSFAISQARTSWQEALEEAMLNQSFHV